MLIKNKALTRFIIKSNKLEKYWINKDKHETKKIYENIIKKGENKKVDLDDFNNKDIN